MCFHKICTPCNINEHHLQNAEHHVRWPSPAENHEKRSFEFPPAFSFPCNLNKEVSHCQWNSVTLRLNIAYMVDSLIVSLDITVIINNFKRNNQNSAQGDVKSNKFASISQQCIRENLFAKFWLKRNFHEWIEPRHTSCLIKSSW